MRILQLEAENIKKLRVVSITPRGNVVTITGANGAGKTSVLDAIFWAIAGSKEIQAKPIRRGAQSAKIRLDLGDVIVKRQFSEDTGTRVTVETVDGARFPSPQKLLDDLFASLSFDPLAFTRMSAKDRAETLRRLAPLDVDVDELDRLNARDYEVRAEWNKKVRSLTERVETLAAGVDETMETAAVDVGGLLHEMEEASAHNTHVESEREARRSREALVLRLDRDLVDLLEDRARLDEKINRAEEQRAAIRLQLDQSPPAPEPIDVSELRRTVQEAQKTNEQRAAQLRQRERYQAAREELAASRERATALTMAMEARVAEKNAAIARAKMPVDGLGFVGDYVTYNDVPFEQASQAEQLRVSFAMAMASNPKLRVVLIRDGSLLDEDSLELVSQMAEAHDFQVWLEKAEKRGRVGILLEDGAVVAIDGVPVEQPELTSDVLL